MRIKMVVNDDVAQDTWNVLVDKKPSKGWEEIIDRYCNCLHDAPDGLEAGDYAQLVVDFFNDTLKPGEMPRRLVSAEWV
jgi:hypothetical protein